MESENAMAETLRTHGAAATDPAGPQPRWFACYTRARHEKRVCRLLAERGFETYLPLVGRESQWKDRRKVVDWPMFPSYVFSRFSPLETHRVLDVPGVATLVKVNGRPAPIPDEELENVRRFVDGLRAGGLKVERRPFLAEGDWVEVLDGPLQGVRGVVVKNRGSRRVIIGLQVIGEGLEVDIRTSLLQPIPAP
ncbi:UpxY family transcription antiterminator [soil metagenome]